MQNFATTDSNILSFIILIIMYFNAYNKFEKMFTSYKLFIALIRINMAFIIIEFLTWMFNGKPGIYNMMANVGFNLLLYIVALIGPLLWILYVDYQVFHCDERILKIKKYLYSIFFINALLSVASLYTGWFFRVDSNNIYHRGELFFLFLIINYFLFVYSILFTVKNRDKLERRYYYSMLFFYVPQLTGTTIQVFNYGYSLNWVGMTVSLLIIYFNIQDKSMNTDYLTGAYNRLHIDKYLHNKIRNLNENETFSLVLLDLDCFKSINDKYGHNVGDEALKNTVKILKSCIRNNDFIARYGGDEFVLLLDIDNLKMLEEVIERINKAVHKFNHDNVRRYKLSFSIGYSLYDNTLKMNAENFIKSIDMLMYENKKSKCS